MTIFMKTFSHIYVMKSPREGTAVRVVTEVCAWYTSV